MACPYLTPSAQLKAIFQNICAEHVCLDGRDAVVDRDEVHAVGFRPLNELFERQRFGLIGRREGVGRLLRIIGLENVDVRVGEDREEPVHRDRAARNAAIDLGL